MVLSKLINNLVVYVVKIPNVVKRRVISFLLSDYESSEKQEFMCTYFRICLITFGSPQALSIHNSKHTNEEDSFCLFWSMLLIVYQNIQNHMICCTQKNWIKFQSLRIHTSWAYQFDDWDNILYDDKIISYFLHDGLEITVEINDYVCHYFYAQSFSH